MRLFELIYKEVVKNGYSPFRSPENRIVVFEDKAQIETKIMMYDEDVQKVVNELIFTGSKVNEDFREEFVNYFFNREPHWDSLYIFRAKLKGILKTKEAVLNMLYLKSTELLLGESMSKSEGHSSNENRSRDNSTNESNGENRGANAHSTNPDDVTDTDLETANLSYADNLDKSYNESVNVSHSKGISSSQGSSNNNSNSTNTQFNTKALEEYEAFKQKIFDELDIKLFSQLFYEGY
ncbi:unknown [Streptococcus phage C1]|uniref:Uncharacterized protein n=1 Tax=Streptococcus phage C1 TaxID=2907838 RepID=Q7Y3E8_BPSC1|nr:adaptor Ad4 [Streptococcus phage C1]AAP42313.1 unknown [Streptococcus phage C1]